MALQDQQGLFAPGTFDFKKVLLRDHEIDLRFKTLEINLFESIFQSCMTGDLTIIDADNLVATLPISEGDIVEIELSCNEKDKIQQSVDGSDIRCVMEIIKVTARAKSSQQDVQTYNLKLASPGWSDNVRDRVTRSFQNKTYAYIVSEVFNDKFSVFDVNGLKGNIKTEDKKSLDIEPTQGEYSIVVPNWKPITLFNWLAGRSQSGQNKDAVNYFFWENKEFFVFRSIDSIMKNGEIGDTYYVKLQNIDKYDPKNYFNIIDYKYEDTGDVLLYALNGTLGSRLITHDIVSKQVTDHTKHGFHSLDYNVTGKGFDYVKEFEKLSHVDGEGGKTENMAGGDYGQDSASMQPLIDESVSNTFSEEPGNTRIIVQPKFKFGFEGVKDDKCEEWLRQRIMQKPLMKYIRMTIYTLGNFKRKAGELIKIVLPSPEQEKGVNDPRLNGVYLVTSVRRIFRPTKHECVMEVIKDDYYGKGGS